MRKAVIDVGSNSVLLLVAEKTPSGWIPVFESSKVTALGAGTKETGLLAEKSIADTLTAIRVAFEDASANGADEVIAAATMAARIATNARDFQLRGDAQHTPIRILSGDDEARLGFLAVVNDPMFKAYDRISIIDPGGQSTELVVAERTHDETDWSVLFRHSFPIGTLGLRGTTLNDESPKPPEILNAVEEIDDLLLTESVPNDPGEVVVLGATGTNLITIRDLMKTWQPDKVHGACLDIEEVSKAVGWMMPMDDFERSQIVGIEPGREKTIHIGSLILERFMFRIQTLSVRVSIRGWRYALLEEEFGGK